MAYKRKYTRMNRPHSSLGSAVEDSALIANKLGPIGALLTGIIGYSAFYFVIPGALTMWADFNKAKMSGPIASTLGAFMDEIFLRRFILPSEWTGTAILLVCFIIAAWKAVTQSSLTHDGRQDLTVFGKIISRFLD